MDSTIISAVIAALASVLVVVAGAFLGTHLTQRASIATAKELATLEQQKLFRERLWDHQRDAYTTMISKVRTMGSLASKLADAYDRGDTGSGYETAAEEFYALWFDATTQFHTGRLIFSEDFHGRYQAMLMKQAERKSYPTGQDDNYYEWMSKLLEHALTSLTEIARRDIGTDAKPS